MFRAMEWHGSPYVFWFYLEWNQCIDYWGGEEKPKGRGMF